MHDQYLVHNRGGSADNNQVIYFMRKLRAIHIELGIKPLKTRENLVDCQNRTALDKLDHVFVYVVFGDISI